MPSAAAHFACARELEYNLDFRCNAFYQGSILPDILAVPDPHYKKQGTYCLVPDLERFWQENTLPSLLRLGYASHLMLDYYFLEEFCPQHIPGLKDRSIFTDDGIYHDYSILNPLLVKHFQLNFGRIDRALNSCHHIAGVNHRKVEFQREWIHNSSDQGPTKYLQFEPFAEFIEEVALRIAKDPNFHRLASQILNFH